MDVERPIATDRLHVVWKDEVRVMTAVMTGVSARRVYTLDTSVVAGDDAQAVGRRIHGRGKTRLTLRGRVVVALMIGVLAWAGWGALSPRLAESAPGVTQVVNYTVRPGDTLWSYASSITPSGGDVSVTVSELMKLNNLGDANLRPGQRIIVPQQ